MSLEPGTKIGPYEILGPIGAGGMGEVYRARDARLAREVAVKILPPSLRGDPDRLRRFEQEARAAGQLNHPNILVVFDTGVHEGVPYVVEELLDGETLRRKVGGAPLPARKAIDYARQAAEGLAAAHQKGIVHRDLKPENLFVTTDGRVKILDFGLAKLTSPAELGSALTEAPTRAETGAGVVLGTVGYMSPEQVRGRPADHRSDLFSLGAILYEMLSGRRAFQATSSVETMNAILKEDPPDLSRLNPDLPPGLARLVEHCLEKGPDERFQSARDLAFQLASLATASSAVGEGGPAGAVAERPDRARKGTLARPAIAAALGLAAVVGAFFAGRQSRTAAAAATYSQLTFRQGTIASGRFTPDGESVVYSAAWEGSPTELFTTRPGSPESRSLGLPSATILSVSVSGEMAVLLDAHFTFGFMRSGTLARAPLAGGVPRPVLENVQDACWSPDGQSLAVVRSLGGRYRLEYPVGTVLYETGAWLSSVRVSRDGSHIGFIDHPGLGDTRGRVAAVDLSGKLKILTEPFSSASGLAWSPAGEEIWFTAGRTGNVRALYAVDLRGRLRTVDGAPADLQLEDVNDGGRVLLVRSTSRRGIVALAPGEETERDLSWLDWSRPADISEDGQWVLFDEQGQGGGAEYSVYLRQTDGSPALRLGSGVASALSPDGNWAATLSLSQRDRIVLLPRGPGQARTISVPGLEVYSVTWFPDGRRILIVGGEKGRLRRLFVMDEAGGSPKPISPEEIQIGGLVSPDGRSVLALGADDRLRIYAVEGGEPRVVPGAEPGDVPVRFGDGGRSIYLARRAGLGAKFFVLDMASGRRALWKDLMPADKAGLIDLGWFLLSADGRSYVYSYRRSLSTLYVVEGLS
jgi:Tol biopolymer transport system component